MKKTAVEWLMQKWYSDEFISEEDFNQAKAMEKEQMEDVFETGHICGMDDCHKMNNGEIFTSVTFEEYYNETFNP